MDKTFSGTAKTTPSTAAVEAVENLGAGVTLQWTCQRRIAIFSAPLATREAVDAWFMGVERATLGWRDGPQPNGLIFDVSAPTFGPTPYMRARINQQAAEVRQLAETRPEIQTYMAVVVSRTIFGQVFKGFINVVPKPRSLRIKGFTNRTEAVTWLTQIIETTLADQNVEVKAMTV